MSPRVTAVELPEPDEAERIKELSAEGLTPSQIVSAVWNIKPSRSKSYIQRLSEVKTVFQTIT